MSPNVAIPDGGILQPFSIFSIPFAKILHPFAFSFSKILHRQIENENGDSPKCQIENSKSTLPI